MNNKVYQEKKKIYCAIYTRKSTSEGLDQDFTSLDAQREAAESYIASQRNEGWLALPDRYDDAGYTGANVERPALQKLLSDIKDGRVDCIVVYKVDRLSRSLLDFTQLLEVFEKNSVTFVSVTQNFNTNTSMGRLTLNILLSFAQFEREIISERTRDKMAAGRRKGKWLGGRPVLGYDLDRENHKLIVNEKEAETVREIFDLYIKERSLLSVAIRLNDKGYETKKFVTKSGKVLGEEKFKNTYIQHIIKNVLYIGKVKYMGQLYQGLHEPIVGEDVFKKAQEILASNRVARQSSKNTKNIGLLNHLLRCKACNSIMFHTYSAKGNYKYRYYVCMNAQKRGYSYCPTRSVNAQAIEDAVIDALRKIACDSKVQEQSIKSLRESLQEEIEHLKEEQKNIGSEVQDLSIRIKDLKESLEHKKGDQNLSAIEVNNLKGKLLNDERLMSEMRIKKIQIEEELVTREEFMEALSVTSPVWDTLFPQEKRRILKLMLREVDYDGRNGTLGLTLNGKGIKLLNSEINPSAKDTTNGQPDYKYGHEVRV
jgi:site-specific DNA recombinase